MKVIPVRQIKKSSPESDTAESFSIRVVEELLAGKDLQHDTHRHDYFFILALKKGQGFHEIDFVKYQINDYCLFFLRPGQVHQLQLEKGSEGFVVQFNSAFYYPHDQEESKLLRQVSKKTYCQLDEKRTGKLFKILSNMFEENAEKQEGFTDVIRSNLGILFIELFRQRKQIDQHLPHKESFPQEQIETLLELIEKKFVEYKQVSHYAEMLHISPYQLNSLTKKALGKTCSELIDEYIVLEAKRNLLATTNQVKEIAFNLGFEDNSYFIRFFKKHNGQSPEEFRRNSTALRDITKAVAL